MGHVKEFQLPSSQALATPDERVWLKVIAAETLEGLGKTNNGYVHLDSLPRKMADMASGTGRVFVHAHKHPAAVLRAVACKSVGLREIALNEAQRLNSRVCLDQVAEWTLYRGRHVVLDAREAAIGATDVQLRSDPQLDIVVFEVRPQFPGSITTIDGAALAPAIARHTFGCLVTLSEVFLIPFQGSSIVARVSELRPVPEDDEDSVEDDDEEFRGLFTATTRAYVVVDPAGSIEITNNPALPLASMRGDRVIVTCLDEETFPVRRALLRPCVRLTCVAQAGKGKYSDVDACTVALDCCTFDRVLLYLQHEERAGGPGGFKFDPTLASQLLRAAEDLGIAGLAQACQQVLGSFKDRVRTLPIRLDEVKRRNARGSLTTPRSETILVLDYMVLDITRSVHNTHK